MMLVMPRMNPANDNQEKLPNNGWYGVPVFILAVPAVIVISAFRAYGGETGEVEYCGPVEITPFECETVTQGHCLPHRAGPQATGQAARD